MADKREVFTIIEDNSTAEGIKLPGRAQGDAAGSNHVPAMVAKDSSGNYQLIEMRQEGDAAATLNSFPSLAVKDSSGNLQYINSRDEGDAASGVDALPILGFVDASGNYKYPLINADGELVVSHEGGGTKKYVQGQATAVVTTQTEVAKITLTASKDYEKIEFMGSNTFPTLWEVIGIEDAAGTPVLTPIAEFLTGPGQYTFANLLEHFEYNSGSTGTLEMVIYGTQLTGAASEMRANLGAIEKA